MALNAPFYGHPAAMPWRNTPGTAGIMGLAAVLALTTELGRNELALLLFILDPATGQTTAYRWFSPIFLHFSWMHLVFNALWMFAVGRLIEWRSRGAWVTLVVLSALAGNLAQWALGDWRFGGLSGVVYGVLGYVWLWDRLRGDRYQVPPAYLGLSLFFLLLGLSGLDGLIGVNMANGAPLGGLLAGLAWAALHAKVTETR